VLSNTTPSIQVTHFMCFWVIVFLFHVQLAWLWQQTMGVVDTRGVGIGDLVTLCMTVFLTSYYFANLYEGRFHDVFLTFITFQIFMKVDFIILSTSSGICVNDCPMIFAALLHISIQIQTYIPCSFTDFVALVWNKLNNFGYFGSFAT